jgi:hypothetical protein
MHTTTFENKYQIGDEVWWVGLNFQHTRYFVHSSKIIEIKFVVEEENTQLSYGLAGENGFREIVHPDNEKELHPTRESAQSECDRRNGGAK